jgi:hypothetical protein
MVHGVHGYAIGMLQRPVPVALPAPNLVGVPGNPGRVQVFAQPAMNQPGVQDFYTLYKPTLVNPAVPQANEVITVPVAPATAVGKVLTTGVRPATSAHGTGTVGFYNGFGPGQADWGFYSGFTAPR